MYTVIAVTGGNDRRQGGIHYGEYPSFEEATERRDEVNKMLKANNVHIKMPDGSWWPEDYKVDKR